MTMHAISTLPTPLTRTVFLRSGLLLLVLVLLPALAPTAAAQSVCAEELRQAQEHYEFGRFDQAITLLNRCLERDDMPQEERERAYRLIGLSYLGKDVLEQARENVRQLLRIAPNYQPDPVQDPPPFRELVAQERAQLGLDRVARDEEPPVEPEAEDGGGIGKWLLIGGGVVVAAAAAVLLLSGGDDGDNGDDPPEPTTLDEAEPNDAPTQAQRLDGIAPLTLNGNAETQDFGEIGVTIEGVGFDDVEDFFRITTTQPGVTLRLDGFSADCDLYLLDPVADAQGVFNIIAQSVNSETTPETITQAQLPAGTYLIGVSIFDPAFPSGAQSAYTLTVDATLTGSGVQAALRDVQASTSPDIGDTFRLVRLDGVGQEVSNELHGQAAAGPVGVFREDGTGLAELDPFAGTDLPSGQGGWVRSSAALQAVQQAPAVAHSAAVTVPLQPGWNIIANPFDVPIAWSTVQRANDLAHGLWRWDGHYERSAALTAASVGEAFYVLNDTGRNVLTIPPPGDEHRTTVRRPEGALTLTVHREGRSRSSVRVGFSTEASLGRDVHDQVAPPGYFEGASLRLLPSQAMAAGPLAEEYRPWSEAAAQFDLYLSAPPHTPLVLEVDGLTTLPGYEAILVDEETGTTYALSDGMPLPLASTEDTRRFTLVLGAQAAVEAARKELLPTTISLSNYPNPFTERTTIRYTLPEDDDVQLVVYDLLGRAVQHLVDGYQEAGQHDVTVDGSALPSGTYVYRLRAGETIETGRFVRVR